MTPSQTSLNRNERVAAAVAAVRGHIIASTKATKKKETNFWKVFNFGTIYQDLQWKPSTWDGICYNGTRLSIFFISNIDFLQPTWHYCIYPRYLNILTHFTHFNSLGSPMEALNMRQDLLQWNQALHLFFIPNIYFSQPTWHYCVYLENFNPF